MLSSSAVIGAGQPTGGLLLGLLLLTLGPALASPATPLDQFVQQAFPAAPAPGPFDAAPFKSIHEAIRAHPELREVSTSSGSSSSSSGCSVCVRARAKTARGLGGAEPWRARLTFEFGQVAANGQRPAARWARRRRTTMPQWARAGPIVARRPSIVARAPRRRCARGPDSVCPFGAPLAFRAHQPSATGSRINKLVVFVSGRNSFAITQLALRNLAARRPACVRTPRLSSGALFCGRGPPGARTLARHADRRRGPAAPLLAPRHFWTIDSV